MVGRRLTSILSVAVLVVIFTAAPSAATSTTDTEQCFLDRINTERLSVGAAPLELDPLTSDYARSHATDMAKVGALYHSSSADLAAVLRPGWQGWGENVGMASGAGVCDRLHAAFMSSPGHRANLLNSSFDYAGVGVVVDSAGKTWTTHVFVDGPTQSTGLPPFVDDDGSVHEGDIIRLAEAGITNGCGPERFCPNEAVTRGQMAAFLVRALDLPVTSVDFFDDDEGSMFESDINALAAAGITKGCDSNSYCPNRTVTRGEMAVFLTRALRLPATSVDYFSDDEGLFSESAINSLAAAGITTGCGERSYCPSQRVTRAQMATFLVRAVM